MLGYMVAVDPAPVVDLDDLQPVLEVLLQANAAVVRMVEDPEFHGFLPSNLIGPASAKSDFEAIACTSVLGAKTMSGQRADQGFSYDFRCASKPVKLIDGVDAPS